jgi:hypothetical protein
MVTRDDDQSHQVRYGCHVERSLLLQGNTHDNSELPVDVASVAAAGNCDDLIDGDLAIAAQAHQDC